MRAARPSVGSAPAAVLEGTEGPRASNLPTKIICVRCSASGRALATASNNITNHNTTSTPNLPTEIIPTKIVELVIVTVIVTVTT